MASIGRRLIQSTESIEILYYPESERTARTPLLFVHSAYVGAWCWSEYARCGDRALRRIYLRSDPARIRYLHPDICRQMQASTGRYLLPLMDASSIGALRMVSKLGCMDT